MVLSFDLSADLSTHLPVCLAAYKAPDRLGCKKVRVLWLALPGGFYPIGKDPKEWDRRVSGVSRGVRFGRSPDFWAWGL